MSGRVTSLYENGIGLDEWMKTKLKKKKKKKRVRSLMAKGNFSFSSSLKIECTQTNLFSSNDDYFKAETADLKISKGDAKRDCTGFFCFVLLLVMPFCFVFLLWIRHKWVTRQTSRVIEYLKKNNHSIVSTRSEKKPKNDTTFHLLVGMAQ